MRWKLREVAASYPPQSPTAFRLYYRPIRWADAEMAITDAGPAYSQKMWLLQQPGNGFRPFSRADSAVMRRRYDMSPDQPWPRQLSPLRLTRRRSRHQRYIAFTSLLPDSSQCRIVVWQYTQSGDAHSRGESSRLLIYERLSELSWKLEKSILLWAYTKDWL